MTATVATDEPLNLVVAQPFHAFGVGFKIGDRVRLEHYRTWPKGTLERRVANKFVAIVPQSLIESLMDDEVPVVPAAKTAERDPLLGDENGDPLPPKEVPAALVSKKEIYAWLTVHAPKVADVINTRQNATGMRADANAALVAIHAGLPIPGTAAETDETDETDA